MRAISRSSSAGTPLISGDLLGRVFGHHRLQLFEVFGALGDEGLVLQALADDDIHQAVEDGHIGAGPEG